jgi:tetratricopeptide (TPR) repeat protein
VHDADPQVRRTATEILKGNGYAVRANPTTPPRTQPINIQSRVSVPQLAYMDCVFDQRLFPIVQLELKLTPEEVIVLKKVSYREFLFRSGSTPMETEADQKQQIKEHRFMRDTDEYSGIRPELFDFLNLWITETGWIRDSTVFGYHGSDVEGHDRFKYTDIEKRAKIVFDKYVNSKRFGAIKEGADKNPRSNKSDPLFYQIHESGLMDRIYWHMSEDDESSWVKMLRHYDQPPIASAYVAAGKKKYFAGDYLGAIREYDLAITENPRNYDAFGLKGYSYYKLNQYDKAIDALKKSIVVYEQYVMGHYNLALAYWANHMENEAIKEINTMILLDPTYQEEISKDPQFKSIMGSKIYKEMENRAERFWINPEDRLWWENKLIKSGFYAVGNLQLKAFSRLCSLTGEEEAALKDLHSLRACPYEAEKDESLNLIALYSDIYTNGQIQTGIVRLAGMLGKFRFDELCELTTEQTDISSQIARLEFSGDPGIKLIETKTNQMFDMYLRGSSYQKYKSEKSAALGNKRATEYFANREKTSRLMIMDSVCSKYLIGLRYWCAQNPSGLVEGKGLILERITKLRSEIEAKQKEISDAVGAIEP